MELQVIPLANMWPDPNNPRKDFGDLDALAGTFELNAVRPHEPVNAPVVVPDGASGGMQMYRIVDGERRWRAMVKAGAVAACACVVCDADEAASMAAMVATDDKARLTDAELSRGVQQMLAVGVAPEQVDKAARLKRGTARRVARVASDGTGQLSIGHLLAAEAFEDPADRERVLAAPEDGWEEAASEIARERETAAKAAALREACEAAGVALVETNAEAVEGDRLYSGCANYPNDVAEAWAGMPEGAVGWICESAYGGPDVRFYAPGKAEDDPERVAARAENNRVQKLMDDARASRDEWLARQFREREDFWGDMMPIVEAYETARKKLPQPYWNDVDKWMRDSGLADKIVETGHVVCAFVSLGRSPFSTWWSDGPHLSNDAGDWLALGAAMASLGYQAGPDERELGDMVRERVEAGNEKKREEGEADAS